MLHIPTVSLFTGGTNSSADIVVESGTGTFRVAPGKWLDTNANSITLTTFDFDLDGYLHAHTGYARILATFNTQTIGLGDQGGVTYDMMVDSAELTRITAGRLIIGNAQDVMVGAVDTSVANSFGALSIVGISDVLSFTGGSTFAEGVELSSTGGLQILGPFTSTNSPSVLQAGTGILTIAAAALVSTTNQMLTITADDVDIQGAVGQPGGISTGTATLVMSATTPSRSIGLGTAALGAGFGLSADELQRTTAAGLHLGGLTGGDIRVSGAETAHTEHIQGVLTLVASASHRVHFLPAPSSFIALHAVAYDGVFFDTDVTATHGILKAEGNPAQGLHAARRSMGGALSQRRSLSSVNHTVHLGAGVALRSKAQLSLSGFNETMLGSGALTLRGGGGVLLSSDLEAVGDIAVHGEDGTANGTVALGVGKRLWSTGGAVQVTAREVDTSGGFVNAFGGGVIIEVPRRCMRSTPALPVMTACSNDLHAPHVSPSGPEDTAQRHGDRLGPSDAEGQRGGPYL